MRTLSLVVAMATWCMLAGCTGLVATASLADCTQHVSSKTPSEKEVNLTFHLILETADHQRTDITAHQQCRFAGFDGECRFSTRGGTPQPVWKEGLSSGPHRVQVNGKKFLLTYPDCKTALPWRVPADADLPKSVEEVTRGDGLWRDHMVYTAYRFLAADEAGKALEGNLMSDDVMEKHGFKAVWVTIQ